MICFTLNIFGEVRDEANQNPDHFDFMSHAFKRFNSFFSKSLNKESQKRPIYRDHLSVFPVRINRLINYTFRVFKKFLLIIYFMNN